MRRDRKREKIKVMHITHDLNIGGLQRVVVDIATSLEKSEYRVSVCALREEGPLKGELLDSGVKTFKIPAAGNGVDYLSFLKLFRILRKERPDIIHTHNTHPLIDGVTAAVMARVPVRIHTDHGRQFPDKKRYMFAERTLAHFTDQIVAVSEKAKKDLSSYEKLDPRGIAVIPNGIDGAKYRRKVNRADKLKELGIRSGNSTILGFAGRLSPEKGLIYLLEAMKLLVRDIPDILLLIAVEGDLSEELGEKTGELGITQNVIFLGPRSDVNEIMGIMDMLVLPSLREGLPLVLLEAMAASLPLVATDVGGNGQAVRNGVNGFLVRPRDAQALCSTIKNLIRHENIRKEFARKSLQIFTENYTIARMISEYDRLYKKYLALKTG
ncbi:MAG: glycosyltransferase [Nitrospirae bacterium]|nr:glycosyltransferase [Nitrospirota bacterium]